MLKTILAWFRRRSKKPKISIESPRGRRILSAGIQTRKEEVAYWPSSFPHQSDSPDYSGMVDLGREIEGRPRAEEEDAGGRILEKLKDVDFNEEDSDSEFRNPYDG